MNDIAAQANNVAHSAFQQAITMRSAMHDQPSEYTLKKVDDRENLQQVQVNARDTYSRDNVFTDEERDFFSKFVYSVEAYDHTNEMADGFIDMIDFDSDALEQADNVDRTPLYLDVADELSQEPIELPEFGIDPRVQKQLAEYKALDPELYHAERVDEFKSSLHLVQAHNSSFDIAI